MEPGAQLGPYKVVSLLGAGSMGEVYRATDTRLDRTVAIKVLPEHSAADPARRERFEREAKAVSSLNHPHICTLHDVGEQDGTQFIVMELVEGQTLESRLESGRLPLDQALEYAIQIADALDKAHRKGVVHRDLKPGNIMLTKSGVKLLDFGLAKLREDVPPTSGLSQAPTLDKSLTAEGMIIGTLQYMAPEQLDGEEADARTDIFAFGVVVYEMVTGKKAFEGKSQASLIGAIMNSEPQPIAELREMIPGSLDRVVRKALAKDANARWQTAQDLCDELRWITSTSKGSLGAELGAPPASGRLWRWAAGVLLVTTMVSLVAVFRKGGSEPVADTPIVRAQLDLGAAGIVNSGYSPAFSPDGNQLAFVAQGDDGVDRLFVHRLDQATTILLDGTVGARAPFFSPDGMSIGFFVPMDSSVELRRIPSSGGAAVRLASLFTNPLAAVWGDGYIIGGSTVGTLWRVPDNGGQVSPVTQFAFDGDTAHRFPQILPGEDAVLFTRAGGADPDTFVIEVASLDDGDRTVLVEGASDGRYLPSGHLVYVRGNALYARTFDVDRLTVGEEEIQVLQGIETDPGGAAQVAFSPDGRVAYRATDRDLGTVRLDWMLDTGTFDAIPGMGEDIYQSPKFSPDGRQLAVVIDNGRSLRDLWVYELDRGTREQRTFGGSVVRASFDWSADGRYLFYGAEDGVAAVTSDRLSEPLLVLSGAAWTPHSVTTDGEWLVGVLLRTETSVDIWRSRLDVSGSEPVLGEPEWLLETLGLETTPSISPDGRWLAYTLDGGTIRVRSLEDDSEWVVADGRQAAWSRRTNELFYYDYDVSGIASVEYDADGDTFDHDNPRIRSSGEILFSGLFMPYAVHPDGDRWAVLRAPESEQRTTVTLLLNFFEHLRGLTRAESE